MLPRPGIMAGVGSSVLLSIVAGADSGPGPLLCLGCWRRCLSSFVAGIVAAGAPAAAGVLLLFGFLPQLHSRVTGIPGQVFAALTRRG